MIKGTTIVTGDRPTGALHLGHYVGSLMSRVALQDDNRVYIIVADTQVMNNDITKYRGVKQNIIEVMKDYLAVGLDPNKVTFFLQSKIPELFELTNYLCNIVTLPQVMRNPTIRAENEAYNSAINLGFLTYPVSQTADIILFDGEHVPVGQDQMPILELSNDIIGRFNHLFDTDYFKTIKPMLSNAARLSGLDGKAKMSKSLGNAIFLSDDEATVNKKVYSMYTDENHLKVSDPGKIEGNVVFEFLNVFHEDKDEIKALEAHYQRGGLGDVPLKKMLMCDLLRVMEPIRNARANITDAVAMEALLHGTDDACCAAERRMEEIRNIICP